MAEGTPLEQVERSLAALEKYSEMWVLDHLRDGHATTAEDMMFYKDRYGKSPWLEQMQLRSTLLLARAIERQNQAKEPRIVDWGEGPVGTRRIFEQAFEKAAPNDTVRDVVERFQAVHGAPMTAEFCEWIDLIGPKKEDPHD